MEQIRRSEELETSTAARRMLPRGRVSTGRRSEL